MSTNTVFTKYISDSFGTVSLTNSITAEAVSVNGGFGVLTNGTYIIPTGEQTGSFSGDNSFPATWSDGTEFKIEDILKVEVGSNVNSIAPYTFVNANNLVELTFKDQSQCNTIGANAFNAIQYSPNNNTLVSVSLPPTLVQIGSGAFRGCFNEGLAAQLVNQQKPSYFSNTPYTLTIPESMTTVGDHAFFNTGLISVTSDSTRLPMTIGDYAFALSTLKTVTLSDGVTSIGLGAFAQCNSLKSVTFGDDNSALTSIGDDAFTNCSDLQSITLPDSVTSIGTNAFFQCSAMKNVVLGSRLTNIGNNVFTDSGMETLTINSNIPRTVFSGLANLTTLKIGTKVTSIGGDAFDGCKKLNAVTFEEPSTCTTIGQSVFQVCSALKEIALPNSVTTLANDTFDDSGLTTLKVTSSNGLGYIKLSGKSTLPPQEVGGKSGVTVEFVSDLQGSGSVISTGSILPVNQGEINKIHTFFDNLGQMPPIHTIFPYGTLPSFAKWNFNGNTGIGQLVLNPGNRHVGNHTIRIRHRHIPTGLIDEINYIIRIVNINDPPVFMSTPVRTARQESLYSYTVRTNDIDVGDLVTVTATTKPSWLSFDGTTLSGTPSRSVWGEYKVVLLATDVLGATATQTFNIMVRKPVCFNEGTKILCLKNGEEQYVAVEQLREGDEVKTMNHGYKKIADMRKGTYKLNGLMDMGMYKMKKQGNMIADLEMSGLHCVLIDANDSKYADDIKRQRGLNNKKFYIDGKFRLRANESHEFQQMEQKEYTIYSFALEEQQEQYGIWANGVLVETTKRKNLEVSNMERVKALVKGKNQ